ncbi:hypothetical protein ACI68E_003613 [Malassezia pachydermatis]
MLSPPPSPYKDKNVDNLKAQATALEAELAAMKESHTKKLTACQDLQPSQDETEMAESWARAPSQGPVLGIGRVRMEMPVEVAAVLERQRALRQQREADAPLPAPSTTAQPQTNTPTVPSTAMNTATPNMEVKTEAHTPAEPSSSHNTPAPTTSM